MVRWFKKEFGQKEVLEAKEKGMLPEDILDIELSEIPPGADGLILMPYWGAGLKNPEARGAILGFSDIHTRVHVYRAIIEGIGFAIFDGMKQLERKTKKKVEKIMISGGGSISDQICQITADMFNLPVCRVQTYETSSLGASIIGYVANGTYKDYQSAINAMVHVKDEFKPNNDNVKIYKRLSEEIYKGAYQHLKPIYKNMRNILNE
jgi:sugar (pentulose or hexulose) kinase